MDYRAHSSERSIPPLKGGGNATLLMLRNATKVCYANVAYIGIDVVQRSMVRAMLRQKCYAKMLRLLCKERTRCTAIRSASYAADPA